MENIAESVPSIPFFPGNRKLQKHTLGSFFSWGGKSLQDELFKKNDHGGNNKSLRNY